MNDERLGRAAGQWLRDSDAPPTDPIVSVGRAMEQIHTTDQVRRWLPFRLFRSASQRATIADTTDYRPGPTPAGNGHSPTVIGRTSAMLSPAKAIFVGAIVFAIGGLVLVAQPFQQPSVAPGAAIDPCTTPIVPVRGTIIWGDFDHPVQTFNSPESRHIRDFVYLSTMLVNDERLNGRTTGAIDWDIALDEEGTRVGGAHQGTFRIDGTEGTWEGTWSGIGWSEGDENDWRAVIELTGTGDYDGLSARLFTQSADAAIEGAIFPTTACDVSAVE